MSDILDQWQYFASPVYNIKKPEFLAVAQKASKKALKTHGAVNPIYPMAHGSLYDSVELEPFFGYVLNTAWNLLSEQGYQMEGLSTHFTEAWVQEHHKYSSMEYHNHGDCDLVGFYVLEAPKDAPKLVIHDPRPMRIASNIPEADLSKITTATRMVNFTLEPGTLMFTPSWLAHSFTRNPSVKPFTFIHLNINTRPYVAPLEFPDTAEVV
jgi:hypothetical protein